MNLAVIAPCYFADDANWKLLRDSCAHQHLPLYPFGCGQPWVGDSISHFEGAPETIRNLPTIYDFVMFTDSEDAFVVAGADEIASKFQAYHCDFLMSAEQNLYPNGLEKLWDEGKKPVTEGLWQYPNGGGWIGRRDAVMTLLAAAKAQPSDEAQAKWIMTYVSGDHSFRLDDSCSIFQTMSQSSPEHVRVDRMLRRPLNHATHSMPCVLHFNGRTGGIKELYDAVYR